MSICGRRRTLRLHRVLTIPLTGYFRRCEISHGMNHVIISDRRVTSRDAYVTVESALRAGGLAHVDLLQIDAEGYHWPIIRSILRA